MPAFFRKKTKPSSSSSAIRSEEHLPSTSSSAPRAASNSDFSHTYSVSTSESSPPQPHLQSYPPPRHPAHSFTLQRSQTQRLRTPPEERNNTVLVNNNSPSALLAPPQAIDADISDQSWPSSPTDKPTEDQEPRRSKRSLFSFHTTSSSSVRDQPSLLERNRSVKRSSVSTRRQQPQQQQQQQQPQPQPRLSLDTSSRDYVVDPTDSEYKSSMPQNTNRAPDPRSVRSTHLPSVPRSNTDPNLLDNLYRQSPIDAPRHPTELAPVPHSLDPSGPRPPSRQSLGPPSPLPPVPHHETSSVSQLSTMSDRPTGGPQQNQAPPAAGHPQFPQGSSQEAGFRNNTAQQQVSEPGRSTPTSRDSRNRDDVSELDVRALLQKHDELQAKYSKVKRYYFEKDAQVQQLQNTVAHQRMAVSRTVLDDNEYANRFGRLDGAIKDLAYSIRKDWKTFPHWLVGFVNEDAPSVGTKEMTAIGRAVMSRWLVEEVFERYFHPALEPTFSRELKNIEMNLRRQQANTYTEEDKENSIARISNWRRTTLDGLTNSLHGPAADEHRSQLIGRLVDSLVATLVGNLVDPPPAGLDSGARMIVENAVTIAEKIPLESRDICVDYIHPGSQIHEATMRVENNVLPPLANVANNDNTTRRSDELEPSHDKPPPPPPEKDEEDRDRESSSNSTSQLASVDGANAREQRKRSVFNNFIGRKPGPGAAISQPPQGPNGSGETVRPASLDERRAAGAGSSTNALTGHARVRLAAFVTAEVRGRGPMNVLVKAPVYPME